MGILGPSLSISNEYEFVHKFLALFVRIIILTTRLPASSRMRFLNRFSGTVHLLGGQTLVEHLPDIIKDLEQLSHPNVSKSNCKTSISGALEISIAI